MAKINPWNSAFNNRARLAQRYAAATGGPTTAADPVALAAPAAPQAAPAPPAPPAPVAPPVSLTAGATALTAGNTRDNTLAALQNQADTSSVAYGFNPDGTPNLSNPYSRAALLRQAHDQATNRNLNSASNIYGGHYQNLVNIEASGNLQNRDALQRQYQTLMDQISQRRVAAQTQAANATILAKAQAADQGFAS